MMVLREKRISNRSEVVQLHLSYGLPDVRALLKEYASHFIGLKDLQHTESEIIYWLEHAPKAFFNYPDKWRVQLSRWAFAVAVRNNLIIESATKENTYYLADCLFARRGRPSKKDG